MLEDGKDKALFLQKRQFKNLRWIKIIKLAQFPK